jgi:hypothetical protein
MACVGNGRTGVKLVGEDELVKSDGTGSRRSAPRIPLAVRSHDFTKKFNQS